VAIGLSRVAYKVEDRGDLDPREAYVIARQRPIKAGSFREMRRIVRRGGRRARYEAERASEVVRRVPPRSLIDIDAAPPRRGIHAEDWPKLARPHH
jgi:hypothetical protein